MILVILFGLVLGCPDEKYCSECMDELPKESKCKTCTMSYFDEKEGKCNVFGLKPEIKSCVLYKRVDDKLFCETCQFGFYKNDKSECVTCTGEQCAICQPDQKCLACFNGLKLKDGKCDSQSRCTEIDKCSICRHNSEKDEMECLFCDSGYGLNSKKICVSLNTNHCWVVNPKSEAICQKCRSGYQITKDGLCNEVEKISESGLFWIIVFLIISIALLFLIVRHQKKKIHYSKINADDYVTVS